MTHITLTREQARQILDAIQTLQHSNSTAVSYDQAREAKSALYVALSAPQQEPIAWASQTAIQMLHKLSLSGWCLTSLAKSANEDEAVPLYTHPAPNDKVREAAQRYVDSDGWAEADANFDALRKALEESK